MKTLLRLPLRARALVLAVSIATIAGGMSGAPVRAAPAVRPGASAPAAVRIVAVVNGTPITNIDVDNRARLFALSTGLPVTPDVLARLKPQITRQLIDERLRMQEIERQHIVVPVKDIAAAIREIEQRNGMPAGSLRKKLASDGVSFVTLVDQIRTQLGWTQVLRRRVEGRDIVTPADVAAQQKLQAAETGKPEYHLAEIFIPIDNPAAAADANRFAETVIKELRAGAPFAVVAAQFSQNQTALEGGDLGWVEPNEIDPQVAAVVAEMPAGAVSNPIAVPGGLDIVYLAAKRLIGSDIATVLSVRQVFLPFTTALNPQAPTPQQMQTLQRARSISARVHSCDQMEATAKEVKSTRPADPGPINLAQARPAAFRDMLAKLPVGKPTQPLVAPDGIAVMIICSRDEKNLAELSAKQIKDQLFARRVELLSRQLQQDLRSRAHIQMLGGDDAT